MKEIRIVKEGTAEFYLDEIGEVKLKIESTIREMHYLINYEEMSDELIEILDNACDELFKCEEYLYKAKKLLKEGDKND